MRAWAFQDTVHIKKVTLDVPISLISCQFSDNTSSHSSVKIDTSDKDKEDKFQQDHRFSFTFEIFKYLKEVEESEIRLLNNIALAQPQSFAPNFNKLIQLVRNTLARVIRLTAD